MEIGARGAPHVHVLLWLNERLSLEKISNNFYAHIPDNITPRLFNLVTNNMMHSCVVSGCKGIIPSASCKYGFPKRACNEIHVDSNGMIILPRNDDESRVIEYFPYFLLKWGRHCHVNILGHEENTKCSPNAIH